MSPMSLEFAFPLPAWAAEEHQRFAVCLAALYHNPRGSISELSCALGFSKSTLNMALKGNGLSKQTCLALEALLGSDKFPRQFFRPDLFSAEESTQ